MLGAAVLGAAVLGAAVLGATVGRIAGRRVGRLAEHHLADELRPHRGQQDGPR